MIKFSFEKKDQLGVYGSVTALVLSSEYNFPLKFKAHDIINNDILWESDLYGEGCWCSYSKPCNVKVYDNDDILIESWNWSGKVGLIVKGCFGDLLYTTPIVKYLSTIYRFKICLETDFPSVFINNPYVDTIFDSTKGELLDDTYLKYNCSSHNFGEIQKQIRKMYLTDYWSTQLGFTLTPEEKTMEFYPNNIDVEIPDGKYVVINPSKTWDCRTWDIQNWQSLTNILTSSGLKVVIVGKDILYGDELKGSLSIDGNNENIINLVNKLDLSQLWHIVNSSSAVVTMNAGLLPFAGTTDAHIIQLGGAIHPHYRTPYRYGTQNYKHTFIGGKCSLFCQSDIKYNIYENLPITRWNGFPSPHCYEHKSTYECHASVNDVINEVLRTTLSDSKYLNKLDKISNYI